jgi:hypothetical protein
MMYASHGIPFDPRGWKGFAGYRATEPAGIARERAVADFPFEIPLAPKGMKDHELRAVVLQDGAAVEVPAQFYDLVRAGPALRGRVALFLSLRSGQSCGIRIYFAHPAAGVPRYERILRFRPGGLGPQHYLLENEYYRIETMPKSGQIWHVWDKLGANVSWHHNEWDENRSKGGDPCHWAPNCWVAYPERVTNGYEAVDPDAFDWHYVFGWDDPRTRIIDGPVFVEIRREGVVLPHPEHSNPNLRRDGTDKIRAEVVYRFYEGCPWFLQASDMRTLEDLLVYFIRNSQFVFLDNVFTHTIVCPDADGLLPGDAVEPAVLRLMADLNAKPFDGAQHSLSNVLPSKLDYTSFYNEHNGDGFAQIQLLERNTVAGGGEPTYPNHMMFLAELHAWAVYYARAFAYTNRRFHAENAAFLPKGQRYEEENACLIYRHRDIPTTLDMLRDLGRQLRAPVRIEPDGGS